MTPPAISMMSCMDVPTPVVVNQESHDKTAGRGRPSTRSRTASYPPKRIDQLFCLGLVSGDLADPANVVQGVLDRAKAGEGIHGVAEILDEAHLILIAPKGDEDDVGLSGDHQLHVDRVDENHVVADLVRHVRTLGISGIVGDTHHPLRLHDGKQDVVHGKSRRKDPLWRSFEDDLFSQAVDDHPGKTLRGQTFRGNRGRQKRYRHQRDGQDSEDHEQRRPKRRPHCLSTTLMPLTNTCIHVT